MKWLLTLLITASAFAQPAWFIRAIEGARTPQDIIDAVEAWKNGERPMAQGVQTIEFDGDALSTGGLTLSVARSAAAYQEDGTSIGANTARYANAKRFAAAPPEPITLSGFSATAFRALTGDSPADDGVPIFVARKGATSEFHVHHRNDPERYYNNAESTGTYVTTLGSNGDLLNGQTSASGGTAAIANHGFLPNSAKTWGNLIFSGCDHLFDDGGGYDSVGCALAYTTIDRLVDGTNPWILEAVTETVTLTVANHHQQWALTKFVVSDTRCVLFWADYGVGTKEGGNLNLTVVDLDGNGDPSFEHVRLFTNYRGGSDDDEHVHCAGLIIDSSGNWIVLISVGDSLNRNRLVMVKLPAADVAAGNFGNGSTFSDGTYGDTGIGGSYTIQQPHANWTSPAVVWGGIGTSEQAFRHNQFIGAVQFDDDCSAFLGAVDETNNSMLKVTWDESNSCPIFEALFVPAATSYIADGVVGFVITGEPGGPFVACWNGESWSDDNTGGSGVAYLEGAVMWSPDGEDWSFILDRQAESQFGAIPHAGRIFLSSAGSDTASYLPAVPPTVSRSPLQIAGSPANSMASGLGASSFTSKDTGITITDLATDGSDLPSSFNGELPPCDRGPMVLVEFGGTPGNDEQLVGNVTLATGLSSSLSDICVKFWVRAVEHDGSNNKSTASIYCSLRDTGTGTPDFFPGPTKFDAGQWTPVVIFVQAGQFDAALNSNWTLQGRFRSEANGLDSNPTQYVLCLEGVYVDGGYPSSHGLAAGASANTEVATIGGVTPRDRWSLYAETMIPWDQWDNRSGGERVTQSYQAGSPISTLISLFRLQGIASDTLDIQADLDDNRIVCATDSASTNGTSNKKWWRRGDTIAVVVTCDGSEIVVYYETTDGDIEAVTVADAITFDEIVSVAPMLLGKFSVRDGVDPNPEASLRNGGSGYVQDSVTATIPAARSVASRRAGRRR